MSTTVADPPWSRASVDLAEQLRLLFSNGWAFFVPYAFVYAAGFSLAWTNDTVRLLFWVCHLTVLAAFLACVPAAVRARYGTLARAVRDPGPWFWALLCLAFTLPGAYLEFPADPWEHFRRLHDWDPHAMLRSSPWVHRIAYFWGWTFFSLIPVARQRLAADLYGGFWQFLLAYQFYRFGFRLSGSRSWARIHVVGAVALFGNSTFGFFRYYALASTTLAYIGYLAAAITFLDLLARRTTARRAVAALGATAALMIFNHVQEFLLFVAFSLAAAFATFWPRLTPRLRLAIGAFAAAAVLLSLPLARRALADPSAFGLTPARFYFPYISGIGVYRVWDTYLNYFTTIGLPGFMALLLAVVLWRSHLLVAVLTLTPFVILTCPLLTIPLAQYGPRLVFTYRILFMVPSSVILVTSFQAAASRVSRASARQERLFQGAALGLLLVLGLHEGPPVFGKLRFQAYRPSAFLQARYVDETAQWFRSRRPRAPWCAVSSDEVTESVLGAFFGVTPRFSRVTGEAFPGYGWSGRNALELIDQAAAYSPCGFLVPDARLGPPKTERSYYGPLSRHWGADRADPVARTPAGLRENVPLLLTRGWTRTFVPPFYSLYEPPAQVKWR